MNTYVAYFNHARPHQGMGQRILEPKSAIKDVGPYNGQAITSIPVLGGLHHNCRRAA